MINAYLNYLIDAIKTHEIVTKNRNLRGNNWKKSNFELLSEIVSDVLDKKLTHAQKQQMGFTISGKTLSNIFKKEYDVSYPIDARSLNTLNKLAVFLNYADWNAFADFVENTEQIQAEQGDETTFMRHIIEKSINAEFSCYAALPVIKLQNLATHFAAEQSAMLQIEEILFTQQAQNWCISNAYNPSAVDLLDFEVLSIAENTAKVKTEEYWLLCWFDTENQKYIRRYKDISTHVYILTKIDDTWKVKTKASKADILHLDKELELA